MKFDFQNSRPAAKAYLAAALSSYRDKNIISSASPPVLFIELTRNCNSRCSFCRRRWTNRPEYNMSPEIFDILLREYIPQAAVVDLRGWGESLILPDFPRYVSRVAAAGPQIMISTNLGCGSLDSLKSLIDHDVFVTVSFDSADRNIYEKIRRGVRYDTVIKNLEFLVQEMSKKGTRADHLRLAVIPLQNKNLDSLPGVIELAARYGISEVSVGELSARFYHPGLLVYHQRRTLKALEKAARLAIQKNVRIILGTAPFKKMTIPEKIFDLCCHPWLYFYVNYLGEAIFCDHLMRPSFRRYLAGHISEPKEKIWNGPRAQSFRKAHLEKNQSHLPWMCRRCLTPGRYADHEHELNRNFEKWLVTEKELLDHLAGLKKNG